MQQYAHFYLNKYIVSIFNSKRFLLLYDFKHKALWFRVAKVGTRFILEQIQADTREDEYIYASKTAYAPAMYGNFFKFAFIRHPVDRFISAWKDKVLRNNYFYFNKNAYKRMRYLSCFIDWVEKQDVEKCDGHIRTQSSLIDLNNIDFIGRMENFKEDFQYVAEKIHLPIDQFYYKNRTKQLEVDITEEQESRIRNIYSKDMQIFYPE